MLTTTHLIGIGCFIWLLSFFRVINVCDIYRAKERAISKKYDALLKDNQTMLNMINRNKENIQMLIQKNDEANQLIAHLQSEVIEKKTAGLDDLK